MQSWADVRAKLFGVKSFMAYFWSKEPSPFVGAVGNN
jgi:hypothetical protein